MRFNKVGIIYFPLYYPKVAFECRGQDRLTCSGGPAVNHEYLGDL